MTGPDDEFAELDALGKDLRGAMADVESDDDWDIPITRREATPTPTPPPEPEPAAIPGLPFGTRYVLHEAIACNGTARGFDQGAGTTTCSVYAADWLAHRITGDNGFFARAEARSPRLARPVAPAANYQGALVPYDGRIQVEVDDSAPEPAYHIEAMQKKQEWGTRGENILIGQIIRINARTGTIRLPPARSGPSNSFAPATEPDDLLRFATTPDRYCLISTQMGTGHAVASHTTATHFYYFDPKVGELTLPLDQVPTWLDKEHTKSYFSAMKSLSATSLIFG